VTTGKALKHPEVGICLQKSQKVVQHSFFGTSIAFL